MEMVSGAKLRHTEKMWFSTQVYYESLRDLVVRLILQKKEEDRTDKPLHPFLQTEREGADCLVVITSDRGLCGAFNHTTLSRAEDFIKRREGIKPVVLVCIGRKACNFFSRQPHRIIDSFIDIGGRFSLPLADRITHRLQHLYMHNEIGNLYFLFAHFISRIHHYAFVEKVLPLRLQMFIDEDPRLQYLEHIDYIMEPAEQDLVVSLLPAFFHAKVVKILLEAFTSEHSARMVSMSNATRNSRDLIESLSLRLNKARQASITKELLDIVTGSESLRQP